MTAAVICGVGSSLPARVVDNGELTARLDTSDEWVRTRTGISRRHLAEPSTATGDLAVRAAARALDSANEPSVDAVVVATTTPDRLCPATAPEVAMRLGLTGVAAWDVSAVCTGFLYALGCARGVIAAGDAERVLVIGAETFSRIVDPGDRNTAVIFADGAGALVVRAGTDDEPGAIGPVVLGSDGGNSDLICIPAGGSRQRTSTDRADYWFRMQGRDVYRHAVTRTTEAAREALRRRDWQVDEVDRFVPHQANARISAAVGDELGIAAERRVSNIADVGNTAAASVPLLLAQAADGGDLTPDSRVLLAAFGGGLTWGATTVVWPSVTARCGVEPAPPLSA